MATFQYEALDNAGKKQKGTIEAATSEDAIQRIRLQGYFPTTVREQKTKKSKGGGGGAESSGGPTDLLATDSGKKKKKKGGGIALGRVKPKQLTTFTRQLSTLQDAGLPVLRSLKVLEGQMAVGPFKDVLFAVADDVDAGDAELRAQRREFGKRCSVAPSDAGLLQAAVLDAAFTRRGFL